MHTIARMGLRFVRTQWSESACYLECVFPCDSPSPRNDRYSPLASAQLFINRHWTKQKYHGMNSQAIHSRPPLWEIKQYLDDAESRWRAEFEALLARVQARTSAYSAGKLKPASQNDGCISHRGLRRSAHAPNMQYRRLYSSVGSCAVFECKAIVSPRRHAVSLQHPPTYAMNLTSTRQGANLKRTQEVDLGAAYAQFSLSQDN